MSGDQRSHRRQESARRTTQSWSAIVQRSGRRSARMIASTPRRRNWRASENMLSGGRRVAHPAVNGCHWRSFWGTGASHMCHCPFTLRINPPSRARGLNLSDQTRRNSSASISTGSAAVSSASMRSYSPALGVKSRWFTATSAITAVQSGPRSTTTFQSRTAGRTLSTIFDQLALHAITRSVHRCRPSGRHRS